MQTRKENGKEDLKEIILSDHSNIILPEVSFPSAYQTQSGVKYGAKSNEQRLASEHEILEYQKRVSRRDSTLTPAEIQTLVSETNERRLALEQSITEQKEQFHQKRAAEQEARHAKSRKEARQDRLSHENDTQRQMRLAEEEETRDQRAKEIQALENRCRREKEEVFVFFEQSSNHFSQKYGDATKKVAGETGIDRIISSRPFSTNRFVHRCVLCGYNNPESLSISKIYEHLYVQQDKHQQFTINEIDSYYKTAITETRRKHAQEDSPTLRNQKLSKELQKLQRLKGANYR